MSFRDLRLGPRAADDLGGGSVVAMSSRTAAAGIYSLVSLPVRHGALSRAAAWAVTGPLGHTWSATVDILLLWVRYGWKRAISRGALSRRRRRR
jgi:hypothetical protein